MIKMESKNGLKEIDIKNRSFYCNIMLQWELEALILGILLDGKLYE